MTGTISVVAVALGALAILMFVIVRLARSSGSAEAEVDAALSGEERREAFDEETARPIYSGSELIKRLRNRMGR